jgi:hypothetical protein
MKEMTRERTEMTEVNTHESTPAVTIRQLGMLDDAAVSRIAELDTVRAPRGELLGAELDGRLVAVVSTTTGEVAADPFRRTAEIVEMLKRHAANANGGPARPHRRLASFLRPGRGAHAPSPPGASGRLLTRRS